MNKIAVLTDSSAYLTEQEISENNIEILPIPIIWNGKEYRDMIDLSFDNFYKLLGEEKQLPTTSTPSLGDLDKKLTKLKKQGFDEVICLFISSGLGSFIPNVTNYAKERTDIKLTIFDPHVTCAGLANMVLLTAKMIKDGHKSEEILNALYKLRETTNVRLIVDDLSHLNRTGRLSNAASFVGGLLNIKPIIGMDVQASGAGKLSVIEKERTYHKAFKRVQEDVAHQIASVDYKVRGTIIDAHDSERKEQWVSTFKKDFPNILIDTSIIGPVIGVHTGQGAIAIVWAQDWKELANSYNH